MIEAGIILKMVDQATRPELIISGADPTATAKELAALIAKRDDFLFNGHAPVHIAVEANCLPRALEVTTEMVRVLAHEICIPTKMRITKGKVEKIPVPLSKDIAQLYLHGLEGSWGLKPFRGIITAPILSSDGSIRIASGYDPRTGLWCHNIPNISIPAKPTEADAKAALMRLRQFFCTFPFADAERVHDPGLGVEVVDLSKPAGLDESSFLAALLTAVCRQSLDLAPGFLCDAPNFSGAGTGKGLLVKAICIIASGVRPSAFTSGHDAEEFDKRLTSALIEAHPAVFLDNFNAKDLTSDILASVLTENPAKVRLMGHTKIVPVHNRTFIGITGNAVQIAEDMARRLLNSHLDAKMEDPEQRKFAPGFLDRVFAARADLLSAALTIWRWGRQTQSKAGNPARQLRGLGAMVPRPAARPRNARPGGPHRRDQGSRSEAARAGRHLRPMVGPPRRHVIKAKDLDQEVIKLIDDKATVKADGELQYSRQRVARFLTVSEGTLVGAGASSSPINMIVTVNMGINASIPIDEIGDAFGRNVVNATITDQSGDLTTNNGDGNANFDEGYVAGAGHGVIQQTTLAQVGSVLVRPSRRTRCCWPNRQQRRLHKQIHEPRQYRSRGQHHRVSATGVRKHGAEQRQRKRHLYA